MNRIPSLDGLRAISIGLVLIAHLTGTANFPIAHEFLNSGNLGVRVFFVISGFLITGILLKELNRTETISLKKFYYRRTLRIFPPYYFFLGALIVLNLPLNEWLYAVFYVSNFAPITSWELGHTWSLAVEEQFYLVMPALLLLGKRKSVIVLCAVVALAPFVRLITFMLYPDPELRWVTMGFQANADSLATGCLLAFAQKRLGESSWYARLLNSKLFIVFPLTAVGLNYFAERPRIFFFVCITLINFCIVLSIDWAVKNSESSIGRLLNSRGLVYIGTLSYSIYLWQQVFLNRSSEYSIFPFNLILVFVFAIISFYCVEKPFLILRQKMEPRVFGRLSETQESLR